MVIYTKGTLLQTIIQTKVIIGKVIEFMLKPLRDYQSTMYISLVRSINYLVTFDVMLISQCHVSVSLWFGAMTS